MEFTPEQQAHIDSLISQSKEGLFGEDELNKRVTSEVDRRVESGIQKGLETHRTKWEKEFSEKAQLTADELAQKELEEQIMEIQSKEKDIMVRSNTIDARDMFSEAGIQKSQYDKFIDILISDDADVTKSNVENFIATLNETKIEIESNIRKEYVKVTPPAGGDSGNSELTREKFNEMGYMDKLKLKETDPTLYAKFIK